MDDMEELLQVTATIISGPLVGVLGVVVGAWLNSALDRRRWQRDWLAQRVHSLMTFNAEVCKAMEQQEVVLGQYALAVQRRRSPLPQSRIEAADAAWRDVLARRYVFATNELQVSISAYDEERAVSAEALNAGDVARIAAAEVSRKKARLGVLDAVQATSNDINAAIAGHLLSRRAVALARLTRRALVPPAPLPSEMTAASQPSPRN